MPRPATTHRLAALPSTPLNAMNVEGDALRAHGRGESGGRHFAFSVRALEGREAHSSICQQAGCSFLHGAAAQSFIADRGDLPRPFGTGSSRHQRGHAKGSPRLDGLGAGSRQQRSVDLEQQIAPRLQDSFRNQKG